MGNFASISGNISLVYLKNNADIRKKDLQQEKQN